MKVKLSNGEFNTVKEEVENISQINIDLDGKKFTIRADVVGLVITGKNTGGLTILPSNSPSMIHVTGRK